MKIKFKYIFLCLSILLNFFWGIYIVQKPPVCKREHIDEINRNSEFYTEKMARQLAEVYMEGALREVGNEREYSCEVLFNEDTYEWIVVYTPMITEDRTEMEDELEDPQKIIGVRKDTGYCTFYESLKDIRGLGKNF